MNQADSFTLEDASVFDTFVVPRYLSQFGELLLQMFLVGEGARVAHVGCRTGYPDAQLHAAISGATLVGVDASEAALEFARAKVLESDSATVQYSHSSTLPTPLTAQSFSHVVSLHPAVGMEGRVALLAEMQRLLYDGGQALLALPIRGSFQEVADLFREYALKHDDGVLGRAIEEAVSSRPSIESLAEEFEEVGLEDVDVEIRQSELLFDSGRAFMEDPVSRMLILPEIQGSLGGRPLDKALAYLRDAIDKYWSEGQFTLTLNIGCASARKPW